MLKRLFGSAVAGCFLLSSPSFAFETEASHALIMDYETGITLFSKNGEDQMIPASMTKIMTAYLVLERVREGRLSLDDTFTVSEEAWRRGGWASGGSTMGLAIGEQVRVEDLLRGVIIQSGNDACIVLAEGISGSESAFADEMTALAREMGLETAVFRNATGLDEPGHRISAYELAVLAQKTISDHPESYGYYAEMDFEWNGIKQGNRNPLLVRFSGADGLKTGHLEVSGYGLVGSAVQNDVRRIIVFNGMEDMRARADESERMMRAAFREFDIKRLFEVGDTPVNAEVYLGEVNSVPLRLDTSVDIGASRADLNKAKIEYVYTGPLMAPIVEGDAVGQLLVTTPAGTQTYPLYAAASVEKKGFMGRVLVGLQNLIAG